MNLIDLLKTVLSLSSQNQTPITPQMALQMEAQNSPWARALLGQPKGYGPMSAADALAMEAKTSQGARELLASQATAQQHYQQLNEISELSDNLSDPIKLARYIQLMQSRPRHFGDLISALDREKIASMSAQPTVQRNPFTNTWGALEQRSNKELW